MTPQNYEFYALKRVSLDKVSDEEMAGYRNEINLLRRLSGNERIIRLVDAELKVGGGGSKGSLMLVMECGEIDLAHLLQSTQTEKLDWISIMGWWKQMLQAVHVIHEEKIVHSDLKPANFVLVKGKLKLIDFGIANAIANDTTNIQRDHQIGTVNYMSPEAIELPEGMRRLKVGRSSDVWSLGCILYQMIYGQPPFAALSTLGKMKAIPDAEHAIDFPSESSPFRPPSSSSSSSPSQQCRPTERDTSDEKKSFVPPAVIETMKACLKRNPKERAEIPELLAASWLSVGVAPSPPPPPPPPPVALNAAECSHPSWTLLKLHQAPIDAHLMSQALQYAIQHGKNDPQWIQDQGPVSNTFVLAVSA
ncbi:kinase-like protein [Sistotremastrum niveocremeum HHB9708]|uniref:Kinase-like protein n=1 Tax=Sistotremastrum niveocremeum HHB9708 TaxID=1314777 RepID=A0A164MAQ0_9AGAM|nr:kinase-like protein [Sistotremastrum niveocremeum HHB9708]